MEVMKVKGLTCVTHSPTSPPSQLRFADDSEADIVAWAWQNGWGGKVFGTSLGDPGDFGEESFTRMLVNSVCWAVGKPVPGADEKISTWNLKRTDK